MCASFYFIYLFYFGSSTLLVRYRTVIVFGRKSYIFFFFLRFYFFVFNIETESNNNLAQQASCPYNQEGKDSAPEAVREMTPTATVRTTATPSRARPLEALKQRPNQDVKKIKLDKTGIEESNEIIVEKREKFKKIIFGTKETADRSGPEVAEKKSQALYGVNLRVIGDKTVNSEALRKMLSTTYGKIDHLVHLHSDCTVRVIFQRREAYLKCLADKRFEFAGVKLIAQAFTGSEAHKYTSAVYVVGFKPEFNIDEYFVQFGRVKLVKKSVNVSRSSYAVVTFASPSGMKQALSAHLAHPLGVTQSGRRSGGGQQTVGKLAAATGSQLRGTAESVVVPAGRVSGRLDRGRGGSAAGRFLSSRQSTPAE